jgi:hypothetical protein
MAKVDIMAECICNTLHRRQQRVQRMTGGAVGAPKPFEARS